MQRRLVTAYRRFGIIARSHF